LITVTILHPNGERQEVLLAGVPRVGEHVRLGNGIPSTRLVVEHVLWVEGKGGGKEPDVIVVVRPLPEGPKA